LGLKHLAKEQAWEVREREAEAASGVLGLARLDFLRCPDWFLGDNVAEAAERLGPVVQEEQPEIIYLPHASEWHPDHRAALPIVLEALRGSALADPQLRTYEIWTPLAQWEYVEDISPVMKRKIQAVRCYRSQLRAFRYDRAVRGLNAYRGALAARCPYAEVFGSASDE
jgi:LmbE family N-acetylglucosaminyl deacetylase